MPVRRKGELPRHPGSAFTADTEAGGPASATNQTRIPRILPERTVEAWTTAYITRWHPTALLWAPTQNDPRRWDLSARSSTGLHFVFEYKAVEGHPEPYVPINLDQLREYVRLNQTLAANLVWYVLPAWSIPVSRAQLLPSEARLRVIRADDPRPYWHAGQQLPRPDRASARPSARAEMALARGCESFFYIVDPEALLSDGRLQTFPGWYGPTGFPVGLVPELAEGLTLEHFMSLVARRRLGVPRDVLALAGELRPPGSDQTARSPLPPHHATAIVVEPSEAE